MHLVEDETLHPISDMFFGKSDQEDQVHVQLPSEKVMIQASFFAGKIRHDKKISLNEALKGAHSFQCY